jgi:glycosyltransferase involved in cell wall biosynthesis
MKILHINSSPVHGGAEIYLKNLCASLSEKGHESIFCYTISAPDDYNTGKNEYFIGESHGIRTGLKVIKKLKNIISRENPNIVHLHSADYHTSPLLIRAIYRMKPAVYTVHNILSYCPKDPRAEKLQHRAKILLSTKDICDKPVGLECIKNRCTTLLSINNIYGMALKLWRIHEYKRFNKVIVHSRFVKDTLIRQGFPEKKISLVRMFIPVEKQWQREPVSGESADKTILFIGSLSRAKGVFEFIKSLYMIRDIGYKAIIVGDGYCYSEVMREIDKMNLSGNVILKGWIPHEMLHPYYNMASVVVLPTMCPEAFGFVGIESMYFGKPVIAFDSGGVREWLKDGINGYIVPFNDIKGLAERLRQLLEDTKARGRLKDNAMRQSEGFLCRDDHIEKILEIYREVER